MAGSGLLSRRIRRGQGLQPPRNRLTSIPDLPRRPRVFLAVLSRLRPEQYPAARLWCAARLLLDTRADLLHRPVCRVLRCRSRPHCIAHWRALSCRHALGGGHAHLRRSFHRPHSPRLVQRGGDLRSRLCLLRHRRGDERLRAVPGLLSPAPHRPEPDDPRRGDGHGAGLRPRAGQGARHHRPRHAGCADRVSAAGRCRYRRSGGRHEPVRTRRPRPLRILRFNLRSGGSRRAGHSADPDRLGGCRRPAGRRRSRLPGGRHRDRRTGSRCGRRP
mgnify:CR=1 FL=1